MADYGIMSAPPGVAQDAGSDDTIAASVQAAQAAAMAHVTELESDTHEAGSVLGDAMPLPPPPDRDTTVLGGTPELPVGGVPPANVQQGGHHG